MAKIRQTANATRIPGNRKLNRRAVLNTSAPSKKHATQPQNCQSVVAVRVGSTVRVAEMNCQPSHNKGRNTSPPGRDGELRRLAGLDLSLLGSVFVCVRPSPFKKATMATIAARGKNIQFAQCVGQESLKNSESDVGGKIFWSRMTGSPNFRMQRPRKKPKISAQMSVAAIVFPDVIAASLSAINQKCNFSKPTSRARAS